MCGDGLIAEIQKKQGPKAFEFNQKWPTMVKIKGMWTQHVKKKR